MRLTGCTEPRDCVSVAPGPHSRGVGEPERYAARPRHEHQSTHISDHVDGCGIDDLMRYEGAYSQGAASCADVGAGERAGGVFERTRATAHTGDGHSRGRTRASTEIKAVNRDIGCLC